MSIPAVLTCYYRHKPGGLCRRLYRAMEALAAAGVEVHYLATEEMPVSGCHFHRLRLPVRRRQGLAFWFWFALLAPPALLALALRHRVYAVFAFGSPYGLLLQPVRILRRVPLALFLRGDALYFHRRHGRAGLARIEHAVEGLALAGAHLYGVSSDLTRRVEGRHRWLWPRSAEVLRNDLPEVDGAGAGDKLPGAAPPLHVFAAGPLYRTKNLDLLLDAAALLPPGGVRVTFYGDGPHRAALEERAARLGLDAAVRFAGWVEPPEVWTDPGVLAMPSTAEGAPNTVLEALARRVPVLASDIPAHRELLPPEALLPTDAPAAWAERWQALLTDPLAARRLVEREARRAEKLRFDWEAAVRRAILPLQTGAARGNAP